MTASPTLTGIEGRVALVTGAGRNLGRAVALALAGAGARVAVGVRADGAGAEAVVCQARSLGADACAVVGDLADPVAARSVVGDVERELGPVEILVHCVGTRPRLRITETTVEEWRRVLDTNLSSLHHLLLGVLPSMQARGFGRVVAVSGPDATHGNREHGAIAASKAGLVALMRVVAVEHGVDGITANLVSPTITETNHAEHRTPERLRALLPIPRPARLDEVAFACLYLASEQASYITGETIRVDGGYET